MWSPQLCTSSCLDAVPIAVIVALATIGAQESCYDHFSHIIGRVGLRMVAALRNNPDTACWATLQGIVS